MPFIRQYSPTLSLNWEVTESDLPGFTSQYGFFHVQGEPENGSVTVDTLESTSPGAEKGTHLLDLSGGVQNYTMELFHFVYLEVGPEDPPGDFWTQFVGSTERKRLEE